MTKYDGFEEQLINENQSEYIHQSKRQLIIAGFHERKYFWYKRNRYGTVQVPTDKKSVFESENKEEIQSAKNSHLKKQVGFFTVLEHDREKLFDSTGKLIIPGGKI
jgi:hypothetical protein